MIRSRVLVLSAVVLTLLIFGGGLLVASSMGGGTDDDTVRLFFDDMESAGNNGWTVTNESDAAAICTVDWNKQIGDAHSGTQAWSNFPSVGQSGSGTCYNHLISPEIAVPADVGRLFVEFWHHYQSEACCDFGVVQVSQDGVTWSTISPQYSGLSDGSGVTYIKETLDLGANFTAGGSVRIRYRFGYDALLGEGRGWYVDDVKVSGLLNVPTPTPGSPTPTPAPLATPEVDHGFAFGPITIVDPQRDVAEPSLRIDPHYNIYACGPYGASRAAEYAQKSEDEGDTFRILGEPPEGRIATGGGGDCELAVGTEPLPNGEYNLAYTGLEALINFSTSYSTDGGKSWIGQSAAVLDTAVDRQWMEGIGQQTVYLGYNSVGVGYQVARSDDGGLTYGLPVTGAADVSRPGPIRIDPDPANNPVANNEVLYFIYNRSTGVGLARSYDRGATWQTFTVAEGFVGDNLFATLAIDSAGNLYAAWSEKGSFNLYYAYSLVDPVNGTGEIWSGKRLVNREPVRSTVMPWIEAGDPGRIVVSYYGSPADGDVEVGAFQGYWHVYVNVSFDALNPTTNGSGSVDFSQTQVTTHPIHWDSICLSGLGCSLNNGDRTLLDFFQNRIAPDGSIHVVYNQSNKIPRDAFGRIAIVSYSKQVAGPSMFTGRAPIHDPRPPLRTASSDPVGDALFPFSSFATPPPPQSNLRALDITNLQLLPSELSGLESGAFEIELSLLDLSDGELGQALLDQSAAGSPASSLLYVVRWFSGTEAYSAVAKWTPTDLANPTEGGAFEFGFNDLSFSPVNGSKLESYPGDDRTISGSVNGNTLHMIVEPGYFDSLLLPATPSGAPTIRPATVGDQIYEVTAFTFGNASAVPEQQEYLNQGDSTAPFDYEISTPPLSNTLGGFQASATGMEIVVGWETLSEQDLVGFNLYRSLDAGEHGAQLNDELIPAQSPGSAQGAAYRWVDTGVTPDRSYFYWLEEVRPAGSSTFYGPRSATVTAPTSVTLARTDAVPTGRGRMPALLLVGLLGVALLVRRARR